MSNNKLDEFDRRILDALQTDGRMTNSDLAEKIGLSPSPCLRRVRQLEAKGMISGYVALVDPQAIGLTVSAFVRVRLDQQDDRHLRAFETAIADFPEVMECYLMTGDADYLLRIVVPDVAAYEGFLKNHLTRIQGVSSIKSSFALNRVKYETALPLGAAP